MVIIEHLSNNIPVVIEQMNCVRSVSLGLTVRAGSAHEFANNNGCAHLVEHMLFKGTKNRSAKKLADDISRMGGNMNAYTSKESTSYYFTTIDSCLQEGIDIVADLVQYPLFDAMEFEKEKLVVLEEIDMYEDSPEDVVHEYLEGAIWEGNPLSFLISGTRRSVESICIRDVEAFWKEHYCPQNMLISIAGNVDVNRVMGWLEESFRLMSNKSLGLPTYLTPVYHKCRYSRRMDIEQVHVNIAFDGIKEGDDICYVGDIANSVLGGNDNSRLFRRIREELGLAYTIDSYLGLYSYSGLLHVDAVLNPSNVSNYIKEVTDNISEMKEKGITQEELSLAIRQIEIDYILSSDSTKSVMSRNANQYITKGKILSHDNVLSHLEGVTIQRVNQFIKEYYNFENASISTVGNIDEMD